MPDPIVEKSHDEQVQEHLNNLADGKEVIDWSKVESSSEDLAPETKTAPESKEEVKVEPDTKNTDEPAAKTVEEQLAETKAELDTLKKRFGNLRQNRQDPEVLAKVTALEKELTDLKTEREKEQLKAARPETLDAELEANIKHVLKEAGLDKKDPPAAEKRVDTGISDEEWGATVLAEDPNFNEAWKDSEFAAAMTQVKGKFPQDYQDDPYFVAEQSKKIWGLLTEKRKAADVLAAKKTKELSDQDLAVGGKGNRTETKKDPESAARELLYMPADKFNQLDPEDLEKQMGVL